MTTAETLDKAQNDNGPDADSPLTMNGAEMIMKALADQDVEIVFGYPGGAVLPIYDAMFKQNKVKHVLVRHEQGAVHSAEGYARSCGKVGVVLVTSGPGATNAVTGLTDALMDSIPVVCLTGQVPTHLIGNDAFQEADTTGITRPCTKHNYLVKRIEDLPRAIHEAFQVASTGRPGPVVVDLPKDILMAIGQYQGPEEIQMKSYRPQTKPEPSAIEQAVDLLANAKKPIIYAGGGVINAGPHASELLTKLVRTTGFPCTNTLMGLGTLPASDPHFIGMLGMHGTYEANMAMHGCDVMLCVGARFDDRVTGNLKFFSPGSKKIHIDIDPSSINKNVKVELPIVADAGNALESILNVWAKKKCEPNGKAVAAWWKQIDLWKSKDSLAFKQSGDVIKPQYAVQRLYEITKELGKETYITTEVGQHQMWAAQHFHFEKPNRWMTSGGLGTMGYGLPAAIGAQMAHPGALVVDIAGEASILMNIQEMSTAVQYRLPVKIFILNNQWMGMVRQWQELIHGGRYSESYTAALPDFVKLAEGFHATGLRAETTKDLDGVIHKMIETDGPVIADICVDEKENVFPMIPSGAAHNDMLLGPDDQVNKPQSKEGMVLV